MCITYCLRHGSWRFIRSISFVRLKCIKLHILLQLKEYNLVFRSGTAHSFIHLTWSWVSKVQSIWSRWRHVSGWRQDVARYDLLHWSRHYVEVSKITVRFLREIKWLINNFGTYYRVYKKGWSVIKKEGFSVLSSLYTSSYSGGLVFESSTDDQLHWAPFHDLTQSV